MCAVRTRWSPPIREGSFCFKASLICLMCIRMDRDVVRKESFIVGFFDCKIIRCTKGVVA
jgi:hypothetical protein